VTCCVRRSELTSIDPSKASNVTVSSTKARPGEQMKVGRHQLDAGDGSGGQQPSVPCLTVVPVAPVGVVRPGCQPWFQQPRD
jgi:hypothetical protein